MRFFIQIIGFYALTVLLFGCAKTDPNMALDRSIFSKPDMGLPVFNPETNLNQIGLNQEQICLDEDDLDRRREDIKERHRDIAKDYKINNDQGEEKIVQLVIDIGVRYNLSRQEAEFLLSEIELTLKILKSKMMTGPMLRGDQLLQSGKLESWFYFERPETQAVYYRILGIPLDTSTRLDHTKSEFFMMTNDQQKELEEYLGNVHSVLLYQLKEQPGNLAVSLTLEALP